MAFPALLDASVLYPVGVRDLLLSVAERSVYAPQWSEAILDEMVHAIVADGRSTASKMMRMRQQMSTAFPDACIDGYEDLIPVMTNHPKDRHVLAAAVRRRVGLIVSDNVKDFPASACDPYEIDVQTADDFLSYALDHDPPAVIGAIRAMATKRRNPAVEPTDLLAALAGRLPTFTSEATPLLDSVHD